MKKSPKKDKKQKTKIIIAIIGIIGVAITAFITEGFGLLKGYNSDGDTNSISADNGGIAISENEVNIENNEGDNVEVSADNGAVAIVGDNNTVSINEDYKPENWHDNWNDPVLEKYLLQGFENHPGLLMEEVKVVMIFGKEFVIIGDESTSLPQISPGMSGFVKDGIVYSGKGDISDISDLAKFPNLEYAFVCYNKISTVPNLSDCKNITGLYLTGNNIIGAGLENLNSKNFPNLLALDISHNPINQLDDSTSLENLQQLVIWDANLDDLSLLSKFPNLALLDVGWNPIDNEDLKILSSLQKLQVLKINDNSIDDLSEISKIKSLVTLESRNMMQFENTKWDVDVLKPLYKMELLKTLDVSSNGLAEYRIEIQEEFDREINLTI